MLKFFLYFKKDFTDEVFVMTFRKENPIRIIYNSRIVLYVSYNGYERNVRVLAPISQHTRVHITCKDSCSFSP